MLIIAIDGSILAFHSTLDMVLSIGSATPWGLSRVAEAGFGSTQDA